MNIRKIIALPLFIVFSQTSNAACFVAENLEGQASQLLNEFALRPDKIAGSFQIFVEGENASIQPSDLICRALTDTLIMCAGGGEYAVLESWALYPEANRITYTQTRTDFPIAEMNGSKLFTGDLKPCL